MVTCHIMEVGSYFNVDQGGGLTENFSFKITAIYGHRCLDACYKCSKHYNVQKNVMYKMKNINTTL